MLVNLEEKDLNVTKLLVLKHIGKTLSYFF